MRCRVRTASSWARARRPDELRAPGLAGGAGPRSACGAWAGRRRPGVSRPLQVPTRRRRRCRACRPARARRADPACRRRRLVRPCSATTRPSSLAFHDHVLRRDATTAVALRGAVERRTGGDLCAVRRRVGVACWRGRRRTPARWRVGAFERPPDGGTSRRGRAGRRDDPGRRALPGERLHPAGRAVRRRAPRRCSPTRPPDCAPRYGAYLDAGAYSAVVSLSPELFLRRRGREVVQRADQGNGAARARARSALRRSAKDAAENVMIVDLMRNDLGRVGETGTVHVAALLDVEPHPGVWHLVSTVDGAAADGRRRRPAARHVPARLGDRRAEVARDGGDRRARARRARRVHRRDRLREPVVGAGVQRRDPHLRDRRRPDRARRRRRDHRRQRADAGVARVPAQGGAAARRGRRGSVRRPDDARVGRPPAEQLRRRPAGDDPRRRRPADCGWPITWPASTARAASCTGTGLPDGLAARVASPPPRVPARARSASCSTRTAPVSVDASPAASASGAVRCARRARGAPACGGTSGPTGTCLTAAERAHGVPLFVAEDGTVLETSRGNVFLVVDDGDAGHAAAARRSAARRDPARAARSGPRPRTARPGSRRSAWTICSRRRPRSGRAASADWCR